MTKKTLINENVIRRWGKLANMAPLTENYLDTIDEEEELEMDAVELPAADGEEEIVDAEMELPGEPAAEVEMSEEEAEVLVQAIADAVSQVTGVEVDVESEEEAEALADDGADLEAAGEDLEALADEEAGMGDAAYNRTDETIDLEVVDDEELTEAVLKRVVERLLSRQ